jgi:hypothetical protein
MERGLQDRAAIGGSPTYLPPPRAARKIRANTRTVADLSAEACFQPGYQRAVSTTVMTLGVLQATSFIYAPVSLSVV